MANKAVDTLETSLGEGDSRVALEVFKAIGLYGQVQAPTGPEDAELVLWEEAREWAEMEISRKGPSSDPLMDQLIWNSEIARLAHERMEELLEQSR